jgi:hypothetical protein
MSGAHKRTENGNNGNNGQGDAVQTWVVWELVEPTPPCSLPNLRPPKNTVSATQGVSDPCVPHLLSRSCPLGKGTRRGSQVATLTNKVSSVLWGCPLLKGTQPL